MAVEEPGDTSPRPRAKDRPEVALALSRVAVRVQSLREAQSLSHRELARRCGLSARAIWRVENAFGDVQLGTLMVVAEQLGVTLVDLISE